MNNQPTIYMREESYKNPRLQIRGARLQIFQLVGEEGLYHRETIDSEANIERIFSVGERFGRQLKRRGIFNFEIANQQEYYASNTSPSISGDPIPPDVVVLFKKGVESMLTKD